MPLQGWGGLLCMLGMLLAVNPAPRLPSAEDAPQLQPVCSLGGGNPGTVSQPAPQLPRGWPRPSCTCTAAQPLPPCSLSVPFPQRTHSLINFLHRILQLRVAPGEPDLQRIATTIQPRGRETSLTGGQSVSHHSVPPRPSLTVKGLKRILSLCILYPQCCQLEWRASWETGQKLELKRCTWKREAQFPDDTVISSMRCSSMETAYVCVCTHVYHMHEHTYRERCMYSLLNWKYPLFHKTSRCRLEDVCIMWGKRTLQDPNQVSLLARRNRILPEPPQIKITQHGVEPGLMVTQPGAPREASSLGVSGPQASAGLAGPSLSVDSSCTWPTCLPLWISDGVSVVNDTPAFHLNYFQLPSSPSNPQLPHLRWWQLLLHRKNRNRQTLGPSSFQSQTWTFLLIKLSRSCSVSQLLNLLRFFYLNSI